MNRPTPGLDPQHMKTYQVASPLTTHFIRVRCEDDVCEAHAKGWATVVDESTALGQKQAAYIRSECRPTSAALSPAAAGVRRYVESRTEQGWTAFAFGPGQQCFAQHQQRRPREELYVVRDGDWRMPGRPRKHDKAEHWVEDMSENNDRLQRLAEKG